MAELKTRPTKVSVSAFLNGIEDDQRRADCKAVAKLMQDITGEKPEMWGPSIVGFGRYAYTNSAGTTEWMVTGFSPRKQNLTLYIMPGFDGQTALMQKLGTHACGKSCLYLKRLSDADPAVLRKLIAESVKFMRAKYSAPKAKKTRK